ncbi:MAG: PSD1 and planctomycete cytochrome C domain-containing protein [Planctomycetota bacterium]
MPSALLLIRILTATLCSLCSSPDDFDQQVAPLLLKRCLECHQSTNPSGGLALDTHTALLKGGDSGRAIQPGNAADSLLIARVRSKEMPPPSNGQSQALSTAEINVLETWVNAGAAFPANRRLDLFDRTTDRRGGRDWWAFQPLQPQHPPEDTEAGSRPHPVDAFLLQSLRQHQLTPAPEASPETLLRRLSWDLTGLPPQIGPAATIDPQTLRDPSQFLAAVNRLLDSPQYGERWARHWLDIVRYADTSGYERDQPKPFAWKYRDWVVTALNQDLPWADFIRHQLAGDEIPDRTQQSVIATGFLRLGTWNDEPNDPADYQWERLEDLVHVTSTAFLGLTVKCARCHDHKFDPIPQADYYRIASAFSPGPLASRDGKLLGGPSAAELGVADVLGWTDITTTPDPLKVLKNGDRLRPLQPVAPGGLSCLSPAAADFQLQTGARTTGLRLQLADWMAGPASPLAARVLVNRLWQHHFGEGLLRNVDNFGFTGGRPSHPQLLDWLAAEFLRSGGSLKHMHRLLLTSAAWKQSSVHPREHEFLQQDAGNRLLWKAFRRRLDAESLRDALLAASGELDLRSGGPGFVPTVSREALEGLSRREAAWTASPPDEQRRRSLYLYAQRSLLPPLMTTFDLCDSTLPCGRRDVSIVAPQALALLNNEFTHSRAAALASAVLQAAGDNPEAQLQQLWLRTLNRLPTAQEFHRATAFLRDQEQRFREPAESPRTSSGPISSIQPALERIARRSAADSPPLPDDCVLFLDAAAGLQIDAAGLVVHWQDQSRYGHHAHQMDTARRPELQAGGVNDQPAVWFSGQRRFLHLTGSLLTHDDCTILAVASDTGKPGHRELLSNWSGRDGNSGSSLFVGMTATDAIRFSDAMSGVGQILQRERPFLITAVNGADGAMLFQQQRPAVQSPARLPHRRLDTPWVIGQQGNIDGEYWNGQLACLLVFSRALSQTELQALWQTLCTRYALPAANTVPADTPSPRLQALASMGLVLLNSNEFAFVD